MNSIFLLLILAITVPALDRNKAFKSARVWNEPRTPISQADLSVTDVGTDGFKPEDEVTCTWEPNKDVSGVTLKFYCKLDNGDVLKVKYSKENKFNPEIYAETGGSRLLRALGFDADRMYIVKKVRCMGCPKDPFFVTSHTQHKIPDVRRDFYRTYGAVENGQSVYRSDKPYYDFYEVAIERSLGKKIEAKEDQGWGWNELSQINPQQGSSKAELDALRLMAVFLNHTDNKPANQGLVCLDSGYVDSEECVSPFAYISDIGTSFGGGYKMLSSYPKFDLDAWKAKSIWESEGPCLLHLKNSPTGSFDDVVVGEEGRQLAARLLNSLTDRQIRQLFEGIHIPTIKFKNPDHNKIDEWVSVFKANREAISSRACKPLNYLTQ